MLLFYLAAVNTGGLILDVTTV